MGIGPTELILIALIVMLLFGGQQLPKVAKSLGNFMNDFNKAKEEGSKELEVKAKVISGSKKTKKAKKVTGPES
jgi:sec-independent protein translocase protein TatA